MKVLVNLDVPDLGRAERFFVEAFGLRPARRLGGSVLEMLGAQAPFYLLQTEPGSLGAGDSARDFNRHWTPVHLDVEVDDLQAALQRALHAGAVQEGEVRHADWGSLVRIADPFGHGWCLIQFTERGYDAITD